MHFEEVVEIIGKGVDAVGVAFIVIGIIVATGRYVVALRRKAADAYQFYRVGLGRALLIGLEVLVAADVIRTVAIDPTFTNVGGAGTDCPHSYLSRLGIDAGTGWTLAMAKYRRPNRLTLCTDSRLQS